MLLRHSKITSVPAGLLASGLALPAYEQVAQGFAHFNCWMRGARFP